MAGHDHYFATVRVRIRIPRGRSLSPPALPTAFPLTRCVHFRLLQKIAGMIQMANGAHSMFSGLSPPIQYAPKDPAQSYFTFRWPPSGLVKVAQRGGQRGRGRGGGEAETATCATSVIVSL